jgi:hypothetical protein
VSLPPSNVPPASAGRQTGNGTPWRITVPGPPLGAAEVPADAGGESSGLGVVGDTVGLRVHEMTVTHKTAIHSARPFTEEETGQRLR